MKKKVFSAFKIISVVCFCALIFLLSYVTVIYFSAEIPFDKLKIIDSTLKVSLFDSNMAPINNTYINGEYIKLESIPKHTIDAFLSIEDKNFYNHNGLNYKRIISATAKNLLSLKFKEGASTISQQLIKNTHLSNEKTLKRKINEIKLTKKLEKEFSKNQILECYLNVIYFGDNCYGIQNASEHYFSHSAAKLSIGESALLAGIIKSPNKYHPIKNYAKCIQRRNLVLQEMVNDQKITSKQYSEAKKDNTSIFASPLENNNNFYTKSAILEATDILKMPEKQIAIGEYKIYTYQDPNKQIALENSIPEDISSDISLISINSQNACIEAYTQRSIINLINVKRQPASAIKPVLVYAPAINENIISPETVILDDEISINGYSPKNIGSKTYGYVSAREALAKSLNIPAVKVLSYIGIEKAQNYLRRQNIEFDANDNNLAISLGGMTNGLTLKELTNCYQTIANKGIYTEARFIKYITDKNGKIIYKHNPHKMQIYRDDTAYLISDMLHQTSKSGTAKLLGDLPYYVCSKTGTSSLTEQNLDAYNISYTSQDVVGCWMGNIDNSAINVVGGGAPTSIVKSYFKQIYRKSKPPQIHMPSSIISKDVDLIALKNEHTIFEASNFVPPRHKKSCLFSKFNQPKQKDINNITITAPTIYGNIKNDLLQISFDTNEYCLYQIFSKSDYGTTLLQTITGTGKNITTNLLVPKNQTFNVFVCTIIKDYKNNKEISSPPSNFITLNN